MNLRTRSLLKPRLFNDENCNLTIYPKEDTKHDEYDSIVAKKIRRDKLEEAKSLVHSSHVPEKLIGREKEYNAIKQFLIDCIKPGGTSSAMYISGVPGTGKTSTTLAALKDLEKSGYEFMKIIVNGMELEKPSSVFVQIHHQIFKKQRISVLRARKLLNSKFGQPERGRLPIVIVIDELDMLCTKRQEVLYDIFNWTSNEEARVNVIAISNALDLPERSLSLKITSRLGTNRVIFQPYTYTQIEDILIDKFAKLSVVQAQPIEFVSKKVANVSGDMRKVNDLIRRGIEIAIEGSEDSCEFEHINVAQKEISLVSRDILGRNLSQHEYILFRAAVSHVQSTNEEEFFFHELYKNYRILCTTLEGINPLHDYAIKGLLMRLCSNHFLLSSLDYNRCKIRVGMDIRYANNIIKQIDEDRKNG